MDVKHTGFRGRLIAQDHLVRSRMYREVSTAEGDPFSGQQRRELPPARVDARRRRALVGDKVVQANV
jgi:hypothetical protein